MKNISFLYCNGSEQLEEQCGCSIIKTQNNAGLYLLTAGAFIVKEEKHGKIRDKRKKNNKNNCSFGGIYLSCLVPLWDRVPSQPRDAAETSLITSPTLQYILPLTTKGISSLAPVNHRWECSSPTMLLSSCNGKTV